MAFCTFQTSTAIAVGSVVKADGASVVLNDDTAEALLVGVVKATYQDEDQNNYVQVHLGGGVVEATLSANWDGLFCPITVDGSGVRPAASGEDYHGYLISQLPPVAKTTGEQAVIYWRGLV
jgi:hypothetical protein